MHILMVDDEPLARSRLRLLLADCQDPQQPWMLSEAANASQAMQVLQQLPTVDVLLLDIQLPATSGMSLAQTVQQLPQPPLIIFVTAHSQYAAQAFDVQACDYLTKPVRLARLQQALGKARAALVALRPIATATQPAVDGAVLIGHSGHSGYSEHIPLGQVVYIKAELKSLVLHTAYRSCVLEGSLQALEQRFAPRLLRIHRSFLVHIDQLRCLERPPTCPQTDAWQLRLHSLPDALPVSRRQLPLVRQHLQVR